MAYAESPYRSAPQQVPSQLERIFATSNSNLDIDGIDDRRVDVDIAVLDTGIDLSHPDLDVYRRINCTAATWPYSGPGFECTDSAPGDGDDDEVGLWHGTISGLRLAGLDNGIGLVGGAPGARLWSVDVSGEERYGGTPPYPDPLPPPTFDLEKVIAGVKWITEHADEIEVVHTAVICAPERENFPPGTFLPICAGTDQVDLVAELDAAIEESIAAGVVYAASAGQFQHMDTYVPQRFDNMLISSQISDSDGLPGGLGPETCGNDDDHSTVHSSWGAGVIVASPGCAGSTATTYTTAAAALLASRDKPENVGDVQQLIHTLAGDSDCAINPPDTTPNVGAGNCDWTDDSTDGIKEPLLDVGDEGVFDPVVLPGLGRSDTVGMFRPGDGTWGLRTANSGGLTNYAFSYAWGGANDVPLAGDWNGDGRDSIGMFRPSSGLWSLRNENSAGAPDFEFAYNWGAAWDVPLVGDWDGDGDDTIGMYRPGGGEWNLRNTNSSGATDTSFVLPLAANDIPLVGDWNGDGIDTVGAFRPSNGTWYLRNSNSAGPADVTFVFYWGAAWDVPIVGDWDGDGDDTIGMFRPGSGTWNLRNTNSSGAVDIEFPYYWGAIADRPVTGDWDG